MKKILSIVLSLMLLLSLAACATTGPAETEEMTAAPQETAQPQQDDPAAEAGKMTPGTYTASAAGMNDQVAVEVEVSEDAIVSVKVTSESETPGIGGPLKDAAGNVLADGGEAPTEKIPQEIVKNQSLKVEAISGATISSYAVINAVSDCLKQAGADVDQWKKEMTPMDAMMDMSTDVVVVGGGGAGLAAAISAAQGGAKVTIVEKNGEVGGDTLVCGAIYNTPDEALQSKLEMTDAVKSAIEAALAEAPVSDEHAALQKEVQAQWDAYKKDGRTDLFDSKEWYALQTWINGDKVANLDLVKVLCYNAYDGLNWIKDLGMGFADSVTQGAGSLWQRTHTSTMAMGTGFISTYVKYIEASDKIQVLTGYTGTELVLDGGRVTGVVCQDRSGNKFTVSASKGVVLATGGFSANSAMVQEYNTSGKWDDLSKTATTNRFSCSQGDGIKMALGAGASLTDMDQIQLLYLGNVKDGQLTKYPPRAANGTDQIIFINKEGKRFVREDGRRDQICLGVLQQTDAMFYLLESGDGAGYKDIKDPSWRSADGFTIQYLEENGYVIVADTLEEMAAKLGMNAADLQATVDAFNASVESGSDEFGRTLFTTKLENGPWVATPRQACVHHTMGGVTIDTEGRVMSQTGEAIPGLYAAGEITGGIHGGNRLGGNAVVDTVVFGKLAGETVVKDAQ